MTSFDATFRGVSLRCVSCGSGYEFDPWLYSCPKCGGLLEVVYDDQPDTSSWKDRPLGVWRYREALPVPSSRKPVTLGEGGTPLIDASMTVEEDIEVYVKFEGSNPTGSFKDRGMTVAVTVARDAGARVTIAASTGNTAASMAAYSSRASLRPVVVLPKGGVALGKLLQASLHGATIIEVDGSFDKALNLVMKVSRRARIYPLNSFNPVRLEGQKTIAYEIVDQLGHTPDTVIVPVGNAGNISAIWKGFTELHEWGLIDRLPRLVGVQAEGAAPLAIAWKRGSNIVEPVEDPQTIASAIRIGNPVNWPKALRALRESKGLMVTVTDNEIIEAMRILAVKAGIGVEPSSAAPLAALRKLLENGEAGLGDRVVLVATGHALKDPDSMRLASPISPVLVEDPESLLALLGVDKDG